MLVTSDSVTTNQYLQFFFDAITFKKIEWTCRHDCHGITFCIQIYSRLRSNHGFVRRSVNYWQFFRCRNLRPTHKQQMNWIQYKPKLFIRLLSSYFLVSLFSFRKTFCIVLSPFVSPLPSTRYYRNELRPSQFPPEHTEVRVLIRHIGSSGNDMLWNASSSTPIMYVVCYRTLHVPIMMSSNAEIKYIMFSW